MKPLKLTAVIVSVIVLFSLCACSGTSDNEKADRSIVPAGTPAGISDQEASPTAGPGLITEQPVATPETVAGSDGLSISEGSTECTVTGIGTCTDKDIVIPSHVNGKPVTGIDEEAFRDTDIKSVRIPGTVVTIDEDAFAGCTALETVILDEGIEIIGESAFYGCSSLKSLTIPSSVVSLTGYSFCDCSGLTDVLLLGCTNIRGNAFSRCTAIRSFLMTSKKNVAYEIANNALQGCDSLETLVLAPGLTSIGSWNFADTPALNTVYLPKSLTVIKACSFLRSGVQKIFYAGSEEEWKQVDVKEPTFTPEVIFNRSYEG